MARIKSVSSERTLPLDQGWACARTEPGAVASPKALDAAALDWKPAIVPGTIAAALRANGEWQIGDRLRFDAFDWWYRTRVELPTKPDAATRLRLHGLATLAEVFVNGERVLASDDMFQHHDVSASFRQGSNDVALRFAALDTALAKRRPRPRWRTKLVTQQQLRFVRSTLLGRMPGFTPEAAAVGPWREIELCQATHLRVEQAQIHAHVAGAHGVVEVAFVLEPIANTTLERARFRAGDNEGELAVTASADGKYRVSGQIQVPNVRLWWPHTHGEPALYPVTLHIDAGGAPVEIDCGKVGFRTLTFTTSGDDFACRINGEAVFCRGACWTTPDIVTLQASPSAYAETLSLVRAAGMNMIRVGGTMVYEHDAFYDACDELGILVWHDFMFANMDYPIEDESFRASVQREAVQFLDRVQARPCLAVLCGNSEVEQQAAMLGLPEEQWRGPLFAEVLPDLCKARCPDVAYCPSTPSGGALPFHTHRGVTHYYGVGAYLRPLEDARRAQVRFASECLAFANVPEAATIDRFLSEGEAPFHHPKWKAGVPRDRGVGWDFEDVRDHYLKLLFGVEPMSLRYADLARYLELSRVVPGELMAQTFAEWRRAGSGCRGALVWFLQDLTPGAGWGVIDAFGLPKAPYYYLKRTLQPIAILCTNEGLNGLSLHLVNDTREPLRAELDFDLYRDGEVIVAQHTSTQTLAPRNALELSADALLGTFHDLGYAYRFGPPTFDVARARLRRGAEVLSETFHFPVGHAFPREKLGLAASATLAANGDYHLELHTVKFAQAVSIEVPGYLPDDNYFHLAPGGQRSVLLRKVDPGASGLRGLVSSLNTSTPIRVTAAGSTATATPR